jgi:hypothetical protein
MRVVEESDRDMLAYYWLKSEWWKLNNPDNNLVEIPRFDDSQLNDARWQALHSYRSPILDPIPSGSSYKIVEIEESDLQKLYIIPVYDWFMDTGKSFKLLDTLNNLQPGRGTSLEGADPQIHHHADVQRKGPYINPAADGFADEYITIVASSTEGPFTIIDGTHRATALLQKHQREPSLPWRAFLVESPNMADNRWHIESQAAQQLIVQLNQAAIASLLW